MKKLKDIAEEFARISTQIALMEKEAEENEYHGIN